MLQVACLLVLGLVTSTSRLHAAATDGGPCTGGHCTVESDGFCYVNSGQLCDDYDCDHWSYCGDFQEECDCSMWAN